MNSFERQLMENTTLYPLCADMIDTLQVNMIYRCNLTCSHCHVDASPYRSEEMSSITVDKILNILRKQNEITTVDITGGSPELNPNFTYFIRSLNGLGKKIIVRTNLTVYKIEGMEDIPEFLAENKVKIIASLPCYTEAGVDGIRGTGTYMKAIEVLKRLNGLGYGQEGSGLEIDIMFNPAKTEMAPDQTMLEKTYRKNLKEMHGIVFNHLLVLNNMPIGRLKKHMTEKEQSEYINGLQEKFNPATVKSLMCRHLISVSPDGSLYDCDFWQMLKLPLKNRKANDVHTFSYEELNHREIVTTPMCFMCTAGAGASCTGALI